MQISGKLFGAFVLLAVGSRWTTLDKRVYVLHTCTCALYLAKHCHSNAASDGLSVCPSVLVWCGCAVFLPVRSTANVITRVCVSNFHATSLNLRCWFFLMSRRLEATDSPPLPSPSPHRHRHHHRLSVPGGVLIASLLPSM